MDVRDEGATARRHKQRVRATRPSSPESRLVLSREQGIRSDLGLDVPVSPLPEVLLSKGSAAQLPPCVAGLPAHGPTAGPHHRRCSHNSPCNPHTSVCLYVVVQSGLQAREHHPPPHPPPRTRARLSQFAGHDAFHVSDTQCEGGWVRQSELLDCNLASAELPLQQPVVMCSVPFGWALA